MSACSPKALRHCLGTPLTNLVEIPCDPSKRCLTHASHMAPIQLISKVAPILHSLHPTNKPPAPCGTGATVSPRGFWPEDGVKDLVFHKWWVLPGLLVIISCFGGLQALPVYSALSSALCPPRFK